MKRFRTSTIRIEFLSFILFLFQMKLKFLKMKKTISNLDFDYQNLMFSKQNITLNLAIYGLIVGVLIIRTLPISPFLESVFDNHLVFYLIMTFCCFSAFFVFNREHVLYSFLKNPISYRQTFIVSILIVLFSNFLSLFSPDIRQYASVGTISQNEHLSSLFIAPMVGFSEELFNLVIFLTVFSLISYLLKFLKYKCVFSLLVTAAAFGLLHFKSSEYIFFIGASHILILFLTMYYKSIVPSIVSHTFNNAFIALYYINNDLRQTIIYFSCVALFLSFFPLMFKNKRRVNRLIVEKR